MNRKKVIRLFNELVKLGYLEDRMEYSFEMLLTSYPDLNSREVYSLYRRIHSN
jgi:hypothetical protein